MAIEGTKRKLEEISVEEPMQKLDICSICKYEFNHNQNDGGNQDDPCKAQEGEHPGKKKLNMDAAIWEEYKEWNTDPMEDTIDNLDYATGWIWTCCDGDGYHGGCIPRPHKGTKFPDGASVLLGGNPGNENTPNAKHQKVYESGKKSSNGVIDLVDEAEALKEPQTEGKWPAKAQEVIVLSDSNNEEEESEEEYDEDDLEHIETCTVCRREYNSEDGNQECLSHDEWLVIVEDCPLSEAEKEALDEDENPEWFVWRCCGEPADSLGCRLDNYHHPDRGMGY